ncbi:GlxA family transcriptional regulator [Pseudomonas aeruginosa]|uniref:GlxA family transcriptional regulator n=1 Tax=Pseudomonas aeruginosa TaxID=287 RepID=UPI00104804C6|nr:GlxA family transcriptional regulator [Pseudomonas aeruginosa]
MTTYAPGVPPQNRNPQSIGFLLLDNFTLISLASAVEPLRMANQLSGRELYRWHTLSLDGRQVWASDGLQITRLAAMQEAFPRVAMSTRLFSIDRNRFTSSGGTAPMDMMLHLIGREHGRELSAAISEMFIYERIRNEQDHQRVPLKHMLGTNQPKLQEIVALMEANLEEPIDLDELAVYVNVSRRQLERLFQKYLHCSPSRYYLKLRLIRARQLLKQTSMSIIEVASVCGFVSTPHFSKCYREYFGIPPRDERQGQPLGQPVVLMPIPQDLALMPNSSALSALSQAQGESTFASVRI